MQTLRQQQRSQYLAHMVAQFAGKMPSAVLLKQAEQPSVPNRLDDHLRQQCTVSPFILQARLLANPPYKQPQAQAPQPTVSSGPEAGKRRTSVGWEELFQLKQLFRVSVQALTYRCKDLGIFSQALFRRLFDEFERQGWRHPPLQGTLRHER